MFHTSPLFSAFLVATFGWYFFWASGVFAALSCSITTAAACTGGTNVVILRMSAAANAHAELPSQSTASYANNVVCCSGPTGLGTSCSGTFATVAHLSAVTNAQVEQNTFSQFSQNACISISSGSVSVGYGSSNCTGFDTTLASMPRTSNSHIGSPASYTNTICGTGTNATLTLTTSTDNFSTITPGVVQFGTTTLRVNTSNGTGWNVTLSGDNKTSSQNNLLSGANSITDQTEWIPASATTSAGNAVRISSFANSQNVLAFRVMSASGTTAFRASTWWGTTDVYTDSATSLWAGIASSTISRKIGNSSVQSGGDALNSVLYYLKVPATQNTGTYSGSLTVIATANP